MKAGSHTSFRTKWLVCLFLIATLLPPYLSPFLTLQQPEQPTKGDIPFIFPDLPAPAPIAYAAPEEEPTKTEQILGALLFSPDVDLDGDPSTNPTALTPAPVNRIGGAGSGKAVLYTTITLAVEVIPDDEWRNPAGTEVTFHLWNQETGVDLEKQTQADAWGAAYVEFFLDDLHLNGRFSYSASAAGFHSSPPRSFTIDKEVIAGDLQVGGCRITAQAGPDGRLITEIESDLPIDRELGAAQVWAVRISPSTSSPDGYIRELLPLLVAQPVDDYRARVEIFLDPGAYILLASARSGTIEMQSAPFSISLDSVEAPPVEAIDQLALAGQDQDALVQYRTPSGDAALMRRPLDELSSKLGQPEEPAAFQQTVRLGAFRWRTDTFTVTAESLVDDGFKRVQLEGMQYDPIARSYDLEIESYLANPIEDRLTVQALGPNGIVIYEESVPVLLQPGQPLEYRVTVPADRGEPVGLRMTLDDPTGMEWLIEKVGEGVVGVFNVLTANHSGLSLNLGFKFKIQLLMGITLAEAMISCRIAPNALCETPPPTGLFFDPGNWVDQITTEVRDYLRKKFGKPDATLENLSELFSIQLGGISLSIPMNLRYDRELVNYTRCQDPDALAQAMQVSQSLGAALKEEASQLSAQMDSLTAQWLPDKASSGLLKLPLPGVWFVQLSLSPILAFGIEADQTPSKFGVYVAVTFELGIEGSADLAPPLGWLTNISKARRIFVFGMAIFKTLDTVKGVNKIAQLIDSAVISSQGFGDCGKEDDPPPPNGVPDDRLDPAGVGPSLPSGASGSIAYLQQQVAAAERAGLSRASDYYRLQLRQQELLAFTEDTSWVISHTLELESALEETELTMQGLVSGTILPEPGQTVTEALEAELLDFAIHMGDTEYDRQNRILLDALDLAESRYQALQGQELELQRELRAMAAAKGIGVLDSGLVLFTLEALGSLGIDPQIVQLLPGYGSSGLPDSRFYPPYEAPPVMIVPSGGLYRFRQSDTARAWLEAYVNGGGTLIVLAQADSGDWELLPGGQVRGLGYFQDILCKDHSVRVVNPSPWLAGVRQELPNIQIDGSFTAWPDQAAIIWLRTTGNRMPAMIEYPYGKGYVVAMSAYPDFSINGMQSHEDIAFTRGLFGMAYLSGTGQSPAMTGPAGEPVNFSIRVTNTMAVPATQLYIYADYFDSHAGRSWRWAIHGQTQLADLFHFDPPMESGESRTVEFSTETAGPGIYRIAYFLADDWFWARSQVIPGPLYQVLSPDYPAGTTEFGLETDQDVYRYGSGVEITASVTSRQTLSRTLVVEPEIGLAAEPVTITVGPRGAGEAIFHTKIFMPRDVQFGLREGDLLVSRQVVNLQLQPPDIGLRNTPEWLPAGLTNTLVLTATAMEANEGYPIYFQVRRNGELIASPESTLASADGYVWAQTAIELPPSDPGDRWTASAFLAGNAGAITQSIPVALPASVMGVELLDSPLLDNPNPGIVRAKVLGTQAGGTSRVQALLRQEDVTLAAGPVLTIALQTEPQTVTLGLPMPPALDLDRQPQVVVNAVGRASGATSAYTSSLALDLPLQAPSTSLGSSRLKSGDPLTLTIGPLPGSGMLPAAGPYTLTLRATTTPFSQTSVLPAAAPVGNRLELSLTVPSLDSGGPFRIEVESPRLSGWKGSNSWWVLHLKIAANAPGNITAGETLTWTVTNQGGIETSMNGTLGLSDQEGVFLAQTPISLSLPVNRSEEVTFTVPAQLASGPYLLSWSYMDEKSHQWTGSQDITIIGLDVTLSSRTERTAYRIGEMVSTGSTVTCSLPLEDAQLRLQVQREQAGGEIVVTTLAGAPTWADGVGSKARFYAPRGVAVSADGSVALVSDASNQTIRRIDLATGQTTTLAGSPGKSGSADGIGSQARFNTPEGIALIGDGSLALVADWGNHTIRKIDVTTGEVTTLAGSAGLSGSADGIGSAARFNSPRGVAVSEDGDVALVADTNNHTIRRIDLATGQVTTLAGSAGSMGSADGTGSAARLKLPASVALSGDGSTAVVADSYNYTVRLIDVAGAQVTTLAGSAGQSGTVKDGAGAAARFSFPWGIALSGDGSVALVTENSDGVIRRIQVSTGEVTTLAGWTGLEGSADGEGNSALFNAPKGIALGADGSFALVSDENSRTVRRIEMATAAVSTVSGKAEDPDCSVGLAQSRGIAIETGGSLLVTNPDRHVIQRIDPSTGNVQNLAGQFGIYWGGADGINDHAQFYYPAGIAESVDGSLAVIVDRSNHTIRRLDLATGEVTTLAGSAGSYGNTDGVGSAARFQNPAGVALSSDNSFALITDEQNHTIRRIDLATRQVTTFAGSAGLSGSADGVGTAARFNLPKGIVLSADDSFALVTDGGNTIRMIQVATRQVTTIAGSAGLSGSADGVGSAARFSAPDGIGLSEDGAVAVVADRSNYTVRRIDIQNMGGVITATVSTLAGLAGQYGLVDGVGSAARFGALRGIALTADGSEALVSDGNTNTLRRIDLASGEVSTLLIGWEWCGRYDGVGASALLPGPAGIQLAAGDSWALMADQTAQIIRRIDASTGEVTTIAGTPRRAGSYDGNSNGMFYGPFGVVPAPDNSFALVAETNNHIIRRIDLTSGAVSTLAGSAGQSGTADGVGSSARFNSPTGLVISSDGTFALVADRNNSTIRRIDLSTGQVTTPAGSAGQVGSTDGTGSTARFRKPAGITLSGDDAIAWVADTDNHTIRQIDLATAEVTTVAGSSGVSGSADGVGDQARFSSPYAVSVSRDGSFALASDYNNHTIRRIDLATNEVTTLAGSAGQRDIVDGAGSAARFSWPRGVTLASDNSFALVTDQSTVRMLDLLSVSVTTLREDWLAVDGPCPLSYTLPLTNPNLTENPSARGLLYLQGTLFSREPGSAPAGERHQLAVSRSPFVVIEDGAGAALGAEHPLYRANLPNYAPDDGASAVDLVGVIRNTGAATDTLMLTLERSDGSTLLDQVFPGMAPGELQAFQAVDPDPPAGRVVYTATTGLGKQATAAIEVIPATVEYSMNVKPGAIRLGDPATVSLVLTNTGLVPSVVTADLDAHSRLAEMDPGEIITTTWTITPSASGAITLPLVLTGDISGTQVISLAVNNESVDASLRLAGPVHDAGTLVRSPDAGLALDLASLSSNGFDVIVTCAISGTGVCGSEAVTLDPGLNTLTYTLGAIPAGFYTATIGVEHAQAGTFLASLQFPFQVVEPVYELSLELAEPQIGVDGTVLISISIANGENSDDAWTGSLVLSGAVEDRMHLELALGGEAIWTGSIDLNELAGPQEIKVELLSQDGVIMLTGSILVDAAPRLSPKVSLGTVQAGTASPGGTAPITVTLVNDGLAGDAVLVLTAFDLTETHLGQVAAFGASQAVYHLPVPEGLPAGEYPLAVRLASGIGAGQEIGAVIPVEGPQVLLQGTLDADAYDPGETATWTVELEQVGGGASQYDLSLRYQQQEYTQTVSLADGQPVVVPWSLTAGPIGDWGSVLVANHPPTPESTRYTLLIDSQWIPVIEDPRAWLETGRDQYSAGDTVSLTLHLARPTRSAMVLAPTELMASVGPLLWSSSGLNTTSALTETAVVQGDYGITFALPAVMPTGRYLLRYLYEGEERTLPIDVQGVTLSVGEMEVEAGVQLRGPAATLAAGIPLTITALIDLDAPAEDLAIRAYALSPDGDHLELGPGAELVANLPAGRTPVVLTGQLETDRAGSYQIVLKVRAASTHLELGGESVWWDVGESFLTALTTSRGVYKPGQPGLGTASLYGLSPAELRVTTSAGDVLVDQTIELTGFYSITFPIPTGLAGDEVLTGVVTGSLGMSSTLQTAYRVAESFDVTPPELAILSPQDGSLIDLGSSNIITLTGIFTEDAGMGEILVNGERATLAGNTWSAPVWVEDGANLIEVAALDAAGNLGLGPLLMLTGEPAFGMALSIRPDHALVGELITVTAVLTSGSRISASASFPFLDWLQPLSGNASSGTLNLDGPVAWQGQLTLDEPVLIEWSGEAAVPISDTVQAWVQGDQMSLHPSNPVYIQVVGTGPEPDQWQIYLPMVLKQ